jgi:hypothetical protein
MCCLGPVCVKHTAVAEATDYRHRNPDLVLMKDLITLISQAVTQFCSGLMELVDQFSSEFMIEPPGTMSKDHRIAYMVNRRMVLLNSSEENRWQYFLHGKVFDEASNCDQLLVFGNEILQKIFLLHFYASTYMPLCDEKFLMELNTTTSYMFSHVAVGVSHGYSHVHHINYFFRRSAASTS